MRTRPWIAGLLLGGFALCGLACTTPASTAPGSFQLGGVRPAATPEVNSELARRAQSDATLADWLASADAPDYVAFPSERAAILFYVEKDEAVHFNRERFARTSEAPETDTIRAGHHAFFSNEDRERLGELRRSRSVFEERERRRRAWNYGKYADPGEEPPAAADD